MPEYDIILGQDASPERIQLLLSGQSDLGINAGGDLIIHTSHGNLLQRKPQAYQFVEGERGDIHCRYVLLDSRRVGFVLAAYDRRSPLVIDPRLTYSSFLGGSKYEIGTDITVDAAGNAYVTGTTVSPDFPLANPRQGKYAGGSAQAFGGGDVFITKINPSARRGGPRSGGPKRDFEKARQRRLGGWNAHYPETVSRPHRTNLYD